MYTPGFAAPEQYREPDRLGPWTDVYGVGASMFACLAAFAPQAADARVQEDHLVSAKKIWAGQYSDNILEVIDWCLRLDPLERPQSVFALQKAIRDIPQASASSRSSAASRRCCSRKSARNRASRARIHRRMRFTIFQESRKGSRKVNQDRIAYTYSRDTLLLVRRRRHGRARGRRDRRADRRAAVHRALPAGGEADPAAIRSSSCRTRCCARTRRSARTPTSSRCSRRRAPPASRASCRRTTRTGRTSATRASTCSARAR